ncbi:MBL fold metallo-hydrolase [Butyricicoccus porcorum]|uniref:Metallo-beta-lactamase domain-containing protein n=1 Tax=Butyricicoccus porcorum TaxID=1945634 RepID=A0A252F309_9FIRM|nr:MBL fold metallo-hydrolase [Butyricicoccus porcorum]MDY4482397.1 MBL fold metallo-hydrolase [Butyricicoccus porcorum]OUM20119.1 hypothetical protein CBW42_08640 [Butyricicoccus porcorum]
MKLISLLENTSHAPEIQSRHGLSLYLETAAHRIVFDFGPDDTFLHNAAELGVDIAAADLAFLSHGHYDHGGGLPAFLQVNDHAPIYLHKNAFIPHWSSATRYIGLEQSLKTSPRLHYTDGVTHLGDGLTLISGAPGHRFLASSCAGLQMEQADGSRLPDDFSHEQSLIVEEGDICLLVAGCAHTGILNIMEQAQQVAGRPMTHVVSGFHLCQPSRGIHEPEETVCAIADELRRTPARYFTCHCTGMPSYEILRRELGAQVSYLSGGMQIALATG